MVSMADRRKNMEQVKEIFERSRSTVEGRKRWVNSKAVVERQQQHLSISLIAVDFSESVL